MRRVATAYSLKGEGVETGDLVMRCPVKPGMTEEGDGRNDRGDGRNDRGDGRNDRKTDGYIKNAAVRYTLYILYRY